MWRIGVVACICLSNLLFPALVQSAPRIFYTDVESGPNTGGENNNGAYLSLFGKGFGTDLTQIKVYVGNGEVSRYMYLGPSLGRPDVQQLSVQLGQATSSGPVKVVVNGVSSNTDHTFTVRPGNFYFISLTGSDSNGAVNDVTHPFRTPNYVKGLISPGDFLVVRGGTYVLDDGTNNISNSTWLRYPPNGTAASPNTLMGYPGETVIVKPLNSWIWLWAGDGTAGSHWVISNFNVLYVNCTAGSALLLSTVTTVSDVCLGNQVAHKLTDIRAVNINFDGQNLGGMCAGSGDSPVNVQYSDHVKVLGVSVHDTANNPNEAGHVIYLAAVQNATEVGWNALWNIPHSRAVVQVHQDSFGGACWGQKFLTDIQIHDNLLHDLAGQPIMLDGGTGDIQVYNNLIYNVRDVTYSDIFSLRASGGTLNASLYNNTAYADALTGGQGFMLGFGSANLPQHVTLYNNIFYLTDPQDLWYGSDWFSTDQVAAWIKGGNVTSANNLWYGSRSAMPSFAGYHELNVNPQLVNPRLGNFALRGGSPAIGAGCLILQRKDSLSHGDKTKGCNDRVDLGANQ